MIPDKIRDFVRMCLDEMMQKFSIWGIELRVWAKHAHRLSGIFVAMASVRYLDSRVLVGFREARCEVRISLVFHIWEAQFPEVTLVAVIPEDHICRRNFSEIHYLFFIGL